jgi:glycosyltransferase involved in cell wall biosynthesis
MILISHPIKTTNNKILDWDQIFHKMKILFIIPGLAIGGQEKIGMMLTSALMNFHEVVTVCFEAENAKEFPYATPILRIEDRIYANPLLKLVNIFKRALALRKIKKSFKPDASISFGETAILANAFTYTGELKIAAIHQSIGYRKSLKFIYRKAYKLHDRIAPVSSGINDELQQLYGIENNIVIHNGYDIDAIITSAKQQLPSGVDTFFNGKVLAHLGRFDPPKGHWHLIIFFMLVKQKVPEAKLLLIGNYDVKNEIFNFCIEYLNRNDLNIGFLQNEENIDFSKIDVLVTGHQSNPFKFLSRANVFVFPSIREGFGNALIEAMACGLPVIAADCPTGPREILNNIPSGDQYGILLPPFAIDFAISNITTILHTQWAEKIVELLNDKDKRDFYIQLGLKRCMDFTIKKSSEKWLKILSEKT